MSAPDSPRLVFCKKLQKELPGVRRRPYKNELGKQIYENVSQEAWEGWLKDSVKIINTYRVDLASAEGQRFMLKQAGVYFGLEEGEIAETAWVPPPGDPSAKAPAPAPAGGSAPAPAPAASSASAAAPAPASPPAAEEPKDKA